MVTLKKGEIREYTVLFHSPERGYRVLIDHEQVGDGPVPWSEALAILMSKGLPEAEANILLMEASLEAMDDGKT